MEYLKTTPIISCEEGSYLLPQVTDFRDKAWGRAADNKLQTEIAARRVFCSKIKLVL